MPRAHGYLGALLKNIGAIRDRSGLTEAQLERRLVLGPGWMNRFESGLTIPSIDMVLAILHETQATFTDLLDGLPELEPAAVERTIFGEQVGNDVIVRFRYANFDAQYSLPQAKLEEFERVIKTLRDGLALLATVPESEDQRTRAIKKEAVAQTFLTAVRLWPHINPSDLWWFVVYRAFCDPYNHPAQFARLNLDQSWKRTAGWALEEILVQHYAPFLKQQGIKMFIADVNTKQRLIQSLKLPERVEGDKIDVILSGDAQGESKFFGVINVKASFAERRTDDVPLSIALIRAGYTSPLWTMDCKSTPGSDPVNRGELGSIDGRRSAKRKDIEDEGYFSGCFSYNRNTRASKPEVPIERRINVCDFRNPNDSFSRFIIARWRAFRKN